jgi:hypothetical protein
MCGKIGEHNIFSLLLKIQRCGGRETILSSGVLGVFKDYKSDMS